MKAQTAVDVDDAVVAVALVGAPESLLTLFE